MQIIKDTVAGIHIGTPRVFRNLTVFPLTNGGETKPDYLVLDEALTQGPVERGLRPRQNTRGVHYWPCV